MKIYPCTSVYHMKFPPVEILIQALLIKNHPVCRISHRILKKSDDTDWNDHCGTGT